MALRVLLADESSTIKKAIQMALSDLGVEVKSVPSGLDVLTVSRSYRPDIVFADILLTKKNGYDVCAEIKADSQLKKTPVILMWSSFMQLDQNHYQRVQADASLEKPFDSETLRTLIEKFVPKTEQFPLKGLLNHPALPDFEESETFVRQRTRQQQRPETEERTVIQPNSTPSPAQNAVPPQTSSGGNQSGLPQSPGRDAASPKANPAAKMYEIKSSALSNQDALDDLDDFAEVPLKPKKSRSEINQQKRDQDENDEWSSGSSENFSENFTVETENYGEFEEVTVMENIGNTDSAPDLQRRIQEQLNSYIEDAPLAKNQAKNQQPLTGRALSGLEEQIMKEEIRMMAEKICWQILPEITEKIVREELSKLLNGLEKS